MFKRYLNTDEAIAFFHRTFTERSLNMFIYRSSYVHLPFISRSPEKQKV